jgi:hypothetical protein
MELRVASSGTMFIPNLAKISLFENLKGETHHGDLIRLFFLQKEVK